MLCDFVAVVVRTRPQAIPLAMITMRKSTHGFPFLSHMSMGLRLAAIWETQHRTTAKFPRFRQLNYLQPTRKTTHQQSLPNQRWQFKRFQLRTTKFHRQTNLASNQKISALRKISKSDWSRSKKWREPSEHFSLLDGRRSR